MYSNMGCRGYENTVLECSKQEFRNFSCSRDKVVGITCRDGMWMQFYTEICMLFIYKTKMEKNHIISLIVSVVTERPTQEHIPSNFICKDFNIRDYVWVVAIHQAGHSSDNE